MEKVKAWSDHIILHFWHCASVCKETETTTDEEALVKLKVWRFIYYGSSRALIAYIVWTTQTMVW